MRAAAHTARLAGRMVAARNDIFGKATKSSRFKFTKFQAGKFVAFIRFLL